MWVVPMTALRFYLVFGVNAGPLHGKCALLSLRTCKADVAVGLEEGAAERLDGSADESERKWRVNGKWVFSTHAISG
jgi:hypothetical protein